MAPKAAPTSKAKPEAKAKAKADAKKKNEEPRPEDLIEKVSPPDEKEFEARIDAVQTEIDKLQKQQQDVSARISERSGGKDEYQQERAKLREELDFWSKKMDAVKEKKDGISKHIGEKRQEAIEGQAAITKMKKAIGYTSEADIDDRIAAIEFRLHHESIKLKEEKALLAEIQELKRNRPKVAKVRELEGSLSQDDRSVLKGDIKTLNEEMAQYFIEKKKVSEKLKELSENRTKQTGDMPQLFNEREAISKQIGDKIAERNQIKAERRSAEQAYYAYQAEVRKIRQDRAAKERELRQKEYEDRRRLREAEKLDEQPYVAEITLIEQTLLFCKGLTQSKGPEKKEEKKETAYDNPENTTVLLKKEDREEYLFAPTSKGKKGKSKNQSAKSESSSKPIKHNAETFQLFDKLKLDAPITTDEIPAIVTKLEEKLLDYQEKVKEWEVKREELKRRILEGDTIDDDLTNGEQDDVENDDAKKDVGEKAEDAA